MDILQRTLHSTETTSLPVRTEIKEEYKWDLTHIFSSDEEWEREFTSIENALDVYNSFKGTLARSAENLLNCLRFDDELGKKLERLHLYAMLSRDSDMKVGTYQAMSDRIKNLHSKLAAAGSYIKPEILSIPGETLFKMIDSVEELKIYRHMIEDLVRTKIHTLSEREEEVLALSSEMGSVAYNTFSIFTNVDLKFPLVPDENGNEIEISHARYYAALYSNERRFRRDAFKAYLRLYKDYANTFASLLNGNLKTHIFYAKAR